MTTDMTEARLIRAVQDVGARGAWPSAARALSHFGEHAIGWVALGAIGAAADRGRRRQWLTVAGSAVAAHAAAIVVKRVVRRQRPHHPDVQVLVGTPSALSFPSAHAASTTAAMVAAASTVGGPLATATATAMGLSRVLLGVHYPTDVVIGMVLGAGVGSAGRRIVGDS